MIREELHYTSQRKGPCFSHASIDESSSWWPAPFIFLWAIMSSGSGGAVDCAVAHGVL